MNPKVHNRCSETTTTTGTGNINLLGASNGMTAISSRYAISTSFSYVISGQIGLGEASANEWEAGTGHLSASNILVRDTVYESNNSDSLVNFSAGTKDVYVSPLASELNLLVQGPASATNGHVAIFSGSGGDLIADSGLTLSGSNTGDQTISDATITLTDITTGNFSTSKHGFTPKGNNLGYFLKDDGTWGTPSGSSVLTTKGDISVYSTTADRLPVGTDGQFLSANSAVSTGLQWITSSGGGDAFVANPLSQFAATTSAQLAGVISDETGSGSLVFATSPTLVTPVLGTPASGTLTNCTFPTLNQNTSGTAASLSAVLSPTLGGTGVANNASSTITITGNYGTTVTVSGTTAITLPTSGTIATLAGTENLTNKTVNKLTITAPATSSTLTIADGKTLTASNSITLAGTDSTTMTFPPASASIGYLNIPQNSQSAAYTTVLADSGKHIFHPSTDANARTYTIDSNANVAYPTGTAITFVNMTSQVVTIAITTDTMYLAGTGTTGSRSLANYGTATALKIDSTHWIISGTGLT